jgi:hypothetical protein
MVLLDTLTLRESKDRSGVCLCREKGGTDAVGSLSHSIGGIVACGLTGLALQLRLGVLPERAFSAPGGRPGYLSDCQGVVTEAGFGWVLLGTYPLTTVGEVTEG